MRIDNRKFDELRKVKVTPHFTSAPGSVLIEVGFTKVLCTATWDLVVPEFLKGKGRGWVTAEYGMLPGSTSQRKPREGRTGRADGRTFEIQRLIGRALRAVVDTELMGEKTIWLDCDVLQADGGTRTASVTGSFIALYLAVKDMMDKKLLIKNPIKEYLAAISLGRVKGAMLLDLSYQEDSNAEVDLNVVMTEKEEIVEIQGTAESKPFSFNELAEMVNLSRKGVKELIEIQRQIINKRY